MTKPEKLTKSVLGGRAPALPHPGNAGRAGNLVEVFSVAVDRDADGRLALTFVHGGMNETFVFSNADRRAFTNAILEPHPDCGVCSAQPTGRAIAECVASRVTVDGIPGLEHLEGETVRVRAARGDETDQS